MSLALLSLCSQPPPPSKPLMPGGVSVPVVATTKNQSTYAMVTYAAASSKKSGKTMTSAPFASVALPPAAKGSGAPVVVL